MKNAKDYIEETGQSNYRITSFAYWLTPEGLNNQFIAGLVRKFIAEETDEDFKEAFDGATKEEAARYLDLWELCYMAHWGAPELARAIASSKTKRNEALALRAVSLAQSARELPEVFPPKIGIQWAMARGYMMGGSVCAWLGIQPGKYGHPHNPLSLADAPAALGADGEPVRTGRPPSIHVKVEIVRQIVIAAEQVSGEQFEPAALPGNANDLLDACQRVEKSVTGKASTMITTSDTFKEWLRAAGYSFPAGRTPKDKATFWTRLAPTITGEISAEVFTGVIPEKPL